jgi:hypothetical protein
MKRFLWTLGVGVLCLAGIAFAYVYFHSSHVPPMGESDLSTAASTPSTPQSNGSGPARAAKGPSDLISQLPTGAPAIVFADLTALRASAFAKELASLAPSSQQDPQYTAFVRDTGFDYSRDLDRVAIALWPQSSPTSVLTLADGRFDERKIEKYALRTGRIVRNGHREIFEVPEQDSKRVIRFTFLSPGRIALADGPALDEVLLPSNANHLDPAMYARVRQVSGAAIFAVAKTQNLAQDIGIDASHSAQLARMLQSVRNITLTGQPVAENLNVSADAECDSTLDAVELMTLLDGLRWMGRAALADPKTQQQIGPQWPALDALLKAATLSHNHQFLQLRVQLTQEMLAQAATPDQSAPKSR